MKYAVEIAESAKCELEAAYRFIQQDSKVRAEHWRQCLLKTIRKLETFPRAYPLAIENASVEPEIRETIHGSYRILFTIMNERVIVIHCRHSARLPLIRNELSLPD
jgi:plasmid stabilization system protein ParE